MKFILLHRAGNGESVMINMEHVDVMQPIPEGTLIGFAGDGSVRIQETITEILTRLDAK